MPGPKGAGEKIGQYAKEGEASEDGKGPPAHISEIFGPGGDQKTGENERHPGKGRQEQAGEAEEGQHGGEEQEEKGCVHEYKVPEFTVI
jgi:hypothetical protein